MGFRHCHGRWDVHGPDGRTTILAFHSARQARAWAAHIPGAFLVRCEVARYHFRSEPVWTKYWQRRHNYK